MTAIRDVIRSDESADVPRNSETDLYERDFYSWTQRQAELLRAGTLEMLDIKNLLEEVETLGRSERSSLRSAYRLVALHLLKSRFQPERHSASWTATIVRERGNIADILRENPGLKPLREELFTSAYSNARKEAAAETGLPLRVFPEAAPFTVGDAESESFS